MNERNLGSESCSGSSHRIIKAVATIGMRLKGAFICLFELPALGGKMSVSERKRVRHFSEMSRWPVDSRTVERRHESPVGQYSEEADERSFKVDKCSFWSHSISNFHLNFVEIRSRSNCSLCLSFAEAKFSSIMKHPPTGSRAESRGRAIERKHEAPGPSSK